MKITQLIPKLMGRDEIIAFFGGAKLVKTIDCKYELRGGSAADRAEAQEWISLFFHDAVVRLAPATGSAGKTASAGSLCVGEG